MGQHDLRLAIGSLSHLAEQLYGKKKPYEGLLQEVIKDYKGENRWRTLKAYEQLLGIRQGQSKQLLILIWEDLKGLLQDDSRVNLSFAEVVYTIYIDYQDQYFYFNCHLSQIPRIGEQVQFGFLRGVLGNDCFHVKDIIHEFDGPTHQVSLYLDKWTNNLYKRIHDDQEEYEEEEMKCARIQNLIDKAKQENQQTMKPGGRSAKNTRKK